MKKATTLQPLLLFIFTSLISQISISQINNTDYCDDYCQKHEQVESDKSFKRCVKLCKKDQRYNVVIEHSIFDNVENIRHTIDHKSQITLKLRDVNPFVYKVTLNEIARNALSTEVISDENTKSKEYSNNLKIRNYSLEYFLASTSKIKTKVDNEVLDAKNYIDQKNRYKEELRDLENQKQLIEQLNMAYETNLNPTVDNFNISAIERKFNVDSNSINNKIETINLKISKLINNIDTINSEINKIENAQRKKENIAQQFIIKKKKYDEALNAYLENVNKLQEKVDFYDELIIILNNDKEVKDLINDKLGLLRNYFGESSKASDIINSSGKLLGQLTSNINDIIKIYDNIKLIGLKPEELKSIDNSFQNLINYHNRINYNEYKDLFKESKRLYDIISDKNWTITYQTTDIPKSSDGLFYTIKLNPMDNNLVSKEKTRNYDFEIRNGIKVDFNAGIFYHIGLQDETFRLERNSTEPAFANIIKDDSNNEFVPSLGGVFNVYKRSSSSVKLAFNFGGGTNVDKTFFYLGGGLVLGKSERVGISVGAVGGSVNRIEGAYRDLDRIPIALDQELNDITINTENVYRIGLYVGVTYNLSKKNDENLKKSLSNFID